MIFRNYSASEMKIKREIMWELLEFYKTRSKSFENQELIEELEDRLDLIDQELDRRVSMDSNHQTRLYHGD